MIIRYFANRGPGALQPMDIGWDNCTWH